MTAPVEFGAKISVSKADGYTFLETLEWEPYNEGGKLKEHIGEYKRRFGYYPVSVHADKIYRTRENLSYCKKLGIRLGGPPLGRPPKDKETYRALLRESRQDEIDRIPIEGVFGVAKRTYTLDRVRAKLDSTSGSTIAMVILAMNLKKIVKDLFVSFLWLFGTGIFAWFWCRNRLKYLQPENRGCSEASTYDGFPAFCMVMNPMMRRATSTLCRDIADVSSSVQSVMTKSTFRSNGS